MWFFNKYLIFYFKELLRFPGISTTVNWFRALKRLAYEILLKAWPSNITVRFKFVRMSGSETSTCSKEELLAYSTMVQTLDEGPITSSNFCCNLTTFESAATSMLPALFSNIRFLINSSIFLGGWRLRGTRFSTKMLSCKSFSGINLLKWSFVYLAKFYGRFHLNSLCFGTAQNLLKSAYSSSTFSKTSLSLTA